MTEEQIKLRPCPFCGSQAYETIQYGFSIVHCGECEGRTGEFFGRTGEFFYAPIAVEAWNKHVLDKE